MVAVGPGRKPVEEKKPQRKEKKKQKDQASDKSPRGFEKAPLAPPSTTRNPLTARLVPVRK